MCLGIPGRVLETYESAGLRMARVDFGGIRREGGGVQRQAAFHRAF